MPSFQTISPSVKFFKLAQHNPVLIFSHSIWPRCNIYQLAPQALITLTSYAYKSNLAFISAHPIWPSIVRHITLGVIGPWELAYTSNALFS